MAYELLHKEHGFQAFRPGGCSALRRSLKDRNLGPLNHEYIHSELCGGRKE